MGVYVVGLTLVAIIATAVAVVIARSPFRRVRIEERLAPIAASVARRIRWRNMLAVAASATVAWFLVATGTSPGNAGRAFYVAPLLAAATGIVFFIVVPVFHETSSRRSADLAPRTALTFGGRGSLVLAALLAVGVIATSIALGAVADPGGRTLSRADGYSEDLFPGFYYSVPALAALAVLGGAVVVAIVRISKVRQPGDETLRDADHALRRLAMGVVVRGAAAATSATIAGMLIAAGAVTSSVSYGPIVIDQPGIADPWLHGVALGESIGGLVFGALAVVLAVSAIAGALRTPLAISSEKAPR